MTEVEYSVLFFWDASGYFTKHKRAEVWISEIHPQDNGSAGILIYISCMEIVFLNILGAREVGQQSCRLM